MGNGFKDSAMSQARLITRTVHNVWDAALGFEGGEKGDTTPRDPVVISSNAYDAHASRRGEVLD